MIAGIVANDFVLLGKPPGSKDMPFVCWNTGAMDPEIWENEKAKGKIIAQFCNHNPKFAPVVEPTLRTGIEAITLSAVAFSISDSTSPKLVVTLNNELENLILDIWTRKLPYYVHPLSVGMQS